MSIAPSRESFQFIAALDADRFDLILATYQVSDLEGMAALDLARHHCPETPFLFVADGLGEEVAIAALKRGAIDYVLKQNLDRLVPAIQQALQHAPKPIEPAEQFFISERKRIEEELRQKTAILDVINESVPTPIFVKDRQGRIIYANPATLQVLGKSASEVIGYCDSDLYPNPDDAAQVMDNDRRIMESGQMEVVEESPDGVRTFLGMKVPYRNERGEVIGLIGISNDISDRKQAEEALQENEARLRLIIESAKDYAIFTLDLNGIIDSWNSGAERLLGYSEAEAIGCEGQMIFTPEDNAVGQSQWEIHTALTQGRAENERWHVRQDRSRFWASGLMMPLVDEAGHPQGLVKILQDKTAQKQASDRLQLLYETTSDLLATDQPMALMHNLFHRLAVQLDLQYYYNFMVEEKDNQWMLHLSNHAGISEQAARAIEWVKFGDHLCGLVAQERRQIVLDRSELAHHPNAQTLCALGTTAYAGQPLLVRGKLLGTLSFASCTRHHFTPAEIDLLQSTCDQVRSPSNEPI
ncbi:MAG: PAS domain S-box protein [Leptolyngbyaceae cyanobacterium SL_7_1]|nr:PAS domain S-box protein [Leptolyngbyaceae cyanobacterium SL_7_1]